MNNQTTFKELLILCRVYLANPTWENEKVLEKHLNNYWVQLPTKASPKLLRLRLFLLNQQQAYIPRKKFRVFVSREWLINFNRPSSLLSGLDSRRCRVGPFKGVDASTTPLELVGS